MKGFSVGLTFLLLFLVSCDGDKKNEAVKTDSVNDSIPSPLMETTALEVSLASLPSGFTADTFSFRDTAKHFYAFFDYPRSSDQQLNELVKKLLLKHTEGYDDYHPGEFESASVEAWFSSFAVNHQLVSICFTDQSFASGAAHYNHGYTALNYDTLKKKQVFLTDIFNLRSEKEKQAFCDSAAGAIDISQELLMTGDLTQNTDFIIEKGNVIFYFDDYEKGPSMTTRLVPLDDVKSFIRKEFVFLLE